MAHYQYKIPSDIDRIVPVIEDLEQKWRGHEVDDKTIFSLHLCLEEIMTNAVLHGNKNNPGLIVTIDCLMLNRAIELTVNDQGQGFNYEAIANPTLPQNVGKNRGRGIYIVKNFMDSVEFLDGGRTIKMRKILTVPASTIADKTPEFCWDWEKGKAVSVLHLIGSLNIDTTAYLLRELDKFPKGMRLILACARLEYIDSTGLSLLIGLSQQIDQAGGTLRLCALSEKVKNVFETTRLDSVFAIYSDVNAARQGL